MSSESIGASDTILGAEDSTQDIVEKSPNKQFFKVGFNIVQRCTFCGCLQNSISWL